ncbi:hypothetical protein FRB99_003103 [Tulasnella sp. 403]|nr:hypothetical protein FRB99_003103 [Tulasnella sp. 403]
MSTTNNDTIASRTRSKDKVIREPDSEAMEEEGTAGESEAVDDSGEFGTEVGAKRKEEGDEEGHDAKRAKVGHEGRPKSKPLHDELTETVDGILERGHIYFFYRPKVCVGPEDIVTSLDDVSKFHLLLLPRGDGKQKFRFFVIGKKRLPDHTKGREVFWATLEKFGEDFEKMKMDDAVGERSYSTKTRGERHIEPARVAGRGHYALFSPKPSTPSGRRTHLVYFLTHPKPEQMGGIQEELAIHMSGSLIIQVKNPSASNPPNVGLAKGKQAKYPEEVVEEKFGGDADHGAGKRFIAPNPAGVLDFEGSEVLLIPDKHSVDEIMEGEDKIENELQSEAAHDADKMSAPSVLKELRLDEKTFPCAALEGDWL